MKKVISIIALVVAMVMAMSVAAFAVDQAFTAGTPSATTVTATGATASIDVDVTAKSAGAYYGVLLVEGSDLPDVETTIYYIDQKSSELVTPADETTGTAAVYGVDFTVLPIIPDADTPMTLFVSSNEADLVSVPVTFTAAKEEPAGPAVTFMNGAETVATLNAVDGAVVAPAAPTNVPVPGEGALIDRYEFVGWTDADATATYAAGASIPATAEMTLYAKYQMYHADKTTALVVWGDYNSDGRVAIPDMTQIITYFKNRNACLKKDLVNKKLDADHMNYVYGDIVINGTVNIPDMTQMITSFKNNAACTAKNINTPVYFINK